MECQHKSVCNQAGYQRTVYDSKSNSVFLMDVVLVNCDCYIHFDLCSTDATDLCLGCAFYLTSNWGKSSDYA